MAEAGVTYCGICGEKCTGFQACITCSAKDEAELRALRKAAKTLLRKCDEIDLQAVGQQKKDLGLISTRTVRAILTEHLGENDVSKDK